MTEGQSSEPSPPEELPAYLTDPLSRQSLDRLRKVRMWVDELIQHYEQRKADTVDREALYDGDEDFVTVETAQEGTRVVKKVPCGKDSCTTCPHGPYVYIVTRTGDGLDWEYQGPVDL